MIGMSEDTNSNGVMVFGKDMSLEHNVKQHYKYAIQTKGSDEIFLKADPYAKQVQYPTRNRIRCISIRI